MPAVSWPSEASFSDWTSRSCALRRSSSDCGELARARLHLLEQPHVLDRDHGLVGEGLDDLDLARRESPGSRRVSTSAPSIPSLPKQRNAEQGTRRTGRARPADGIIRVLENIGDLFRPCPA